MFTAVDSLDARVISRFPLRPSRGGTRMKISITLRKISQCCLTKTRTLVDIELIPNLPKSHRLPYLPARVPVTSPPSLFQSPRGGTETKSVAPSPGPIRLAFPGGSPLVHLVSGIQRLMMSRNLHWALGDLSLKTLCLCYCR